jgi:hypothetical protein
MATPEVAAIYRTIADYQHQRISSNAVDTIR